MKLLTTGYHFEENLFPFNLYSPSPPWSCLAWTPTSIQLLSGPAPSMLQAATVCPASSRAFLHNKVISLSRNDKSWHDYENYYNPQLNQFSGHQLCNSAIASVFFVCLLFCHNTLTSQDVARGSSSLPVEWSVLMACVDNNKHRLKCLTYHDVIIYSANAVIW